MIQTTSSTLLDRSRLVSMLMELSTDNLSSKDYNLAERLSSLIGVSGSLDLARALQLLPTSVSTFKTEGGIGIQDDVMATCQQMMQLITSSFVPEMVVGSADMQIKAPTASAGIKAEVLQTYEPYRRFYSAHQVEMAVGLQALRQRVRSSLSGVSVELHQLATLDMVLDQSLALHTRKLFNVIPKLLEQRFKLLLQNHLEKNAGSVDDDPNLWLEPEGWLAFFYHDMRELLLAEFDVRLQPILGLLEALNEQVDTL